MKKSLSIIIALCLALTCLIGCASAEAVEKVENWEAASITYTVIEQGKLITCMGNSITLLPDGTYALTLMHDTDYSSDGGESYNPTNYMTFFVYGTYEVTEVDEDLGDIIINIKSIDRVVSGDYDSTVNGTADDTAAMAAHPFVGSEIILGSDHKIAEMIDVLSFLEISHFKSPY